MVRRTAVFVSFVVLVLFGAGSVQADPIIYSQPSDFPGGTVFASQNDIGGQGAFATVYDDFVLGSTMLVTDVHWQGGYFNPGTTGTTTAFEIAFWADNAGQPGASLLAQTIAGNANESFVGNEFFGPVYRYDVVLTTPFLASATTKYWLSIVSDSHFPPQWGWHTDGVVNNISYQDFLGIRTLIDRDLAFDLTGVPDVPEPASLTLLGTGVVALIGRERRRAKARREATTR